MASGDSLLILHPNNASLPDTLAAGQEEIQGASVPNEIIRVLAFDQTTVEYADFRCILPSNYAGGGLTISVRWGAGLTTNLGIWAAAIRRIDDAEDLDTTIHTYVYQDTGDITPPTVVGRATTDNVALTSGAQMDSLLVDEDFILRIRRPATTGTPVAADQYLHSIHIKET